MKKILVLLIIGLILCGCDNKSPQDKLMELLKKNDYTFVDVRTKEEFELSHLVGAINIPYDEIEKNIGLVDKAKNIFVYCKSGKRSNIAYQILTGLGYNVYDLGAFSDIDLPKE